MAQNILFVSSEPPRAYPIIDQHYTWVPVHGPLSFARLSAIWHDTAPLAVFTYGPAHDQWPALSVTYEVRRRWIHLGSDLPATVDVVGTVFAASLDTSRALREGQPLMSVITTTFRSGDTILRPLRSLQRQSHTNWEWIIWDDSPTDETDTWERLRALQRDDLRIQIFRAPRARSEEHTSELQSH